MAALSALIQLTAEEGRGRVDGPPWRLLRPEKEARDVEKRGFLFTGELILGQVVLPILRSLRNVRVTRAA